MFFSLGMDSRIINCLFSHPKWVTLIYSIAHYRLYLFILLFLNIDHQSFRWLYHGTFAKQLNSFDYVYKILLCWDCKIFFLHQKGWLVANKIINEGIRCKSILDYFLVYKRCCVIYTVVLWLVRRCWIRNRNQLANANEGLLKPNAG